MAVKNVVLCVDIGGSSIKAAQFSYTADGNMVLDKFAYSEFASDTEGSGTDAMLNSLSDTLQSNDFDAKDVHISVSGQNSFIRFVKVPSMTTDRDKVKEIISYEAKQTIPFPMDEVVWDSQIIEPAENSEDNEIDAMLVIVKNEDAMRIVQCVESLGLHVRIIEVAPTACYNAARANMVGNNQCEMILNIGGKCSSLIFVDGGRFFVRSIPISGNTITQQIAKEFNIPYAEAEEMKRRHGFVALGGAYEEPESAVAATVSKIVRNVMTRLHAEINRSVNVYRASQHGHKPEKLYLTGGSSILPFTPRFFAEKLRVPVEYFNPFQVVQLGPDINADMLRDFAHLFGELVGLALRYIGNPPIAISLIPETVRKQHIFRTKRPFFYASAISLIVYLGITAWALHIQKDAIENKQASFQRIVEDKKKTDNDVRRAYSEFESAQQTFDAITKHLEHRENWITFFDLLQYCIPHNVWCSKISVEKTPLVTPVVAVQANTPQPEEDIGGGDDDFDMASLFSRRRSRDNSSDSKKQAQTMDVSAKWLNLDAYIIGNKGVDYLVPEANETIGLLSDHLKKSGLFEGNLEPQQDANTYNFNISKFRASIELKNPINSAEYTAVLRKITMPKKSSAAQGE